MSEERSKGIDFPKCKICGERHAGVAHVWGKKSMGTVAQSGSAPAHRSEATVPGSLPGASSGHGRARVGSNPTRSRSSRTKATTGNGASAVAPRVGEQGDPAGTSGVVSRPSRRGGRAGIPLTNKREIVDALNAGRITPLDGAVAALTIDVTPKPKKKRRKPMVAKDGTNRGRPAGKVPFDKKAHDREKARERRAAKKAEARKATK